MEQNKQKTSLGAKNRCHQVQIKSTLSLSSSVNEPLDRVADLITPTGGKVMFSQASVYTPGQTPQTYPVDMDTLPIDGHCSGRYASYWNAFL